MDKKTISKIKLLFICQLLCFNILIAQESTPIDSLHTLIKNTDSKAHIDHFIALSEIYNTIQNRNLDSAIYYAKRAINLSKEYKAPKKKIDALFLLGRIKLDQQNYDEARSFMDQVLSDSKELSYNIGERKGNLGIGQVYATQAKNYEGILYYDRAYELAIANKESFGVIADMATRLSLQYRNIQDYNKAANILENSIQYLDDPSVSTSTKCSFHINAGFLNSDLNNHDKAIEHFLKTIHYAEKIKHNIYIVVSLANIGSVYSLSLKDHKKALTYNLRALEYLDDKDPMIRFKGPILSYIGSNYYGIGDYTKSIRFLKESLGFFIYNNEVQIHGETLMNLGLAHQKTNKLDIANSYFTEASDKFSEVIDLHKKNGYAKTDLSLTYEALSKIDSAQGNFRKSLENYKLYKVYHDSINYETNIKITERLDFVQQTAKKNEKIAQLNFENDVQRQKAEQQKNQKIWLLVILSLVIIFAGILLYGFSEKKKGLKIINEKNEENKLLMKEIHHRVKNNLQIILSLLNAQIDGNQSDKKLKDVLTESLNKIKSMAIIHNSLYQGNQFTKVCANSYINELIHNLDKSFENKSEEIKFEIDVDKKQIKMGLAIPLGLIVNELITNSHKYAFNDSTKEKNIKISFKELDQPNRFQLIIQDNGIGLPEGFNIDELSSFGIQLVQGLVDQLHGNIEVNQEKGTIFQIYLEEPIAA